MATNEIHDFLHYLSIEEENLLKSMMNFGEDAFLVHNLDELFKFCFDLSPINDSKFKIPAFLYTNVHREFYVAVASFFRLASSKSFNCLRCAIDSTFTAYYLMQYPDKAEVYLSKVIGVDNAEWNKIFRNIKETVKKDKTNFPLAEQLPEIHEFCSIHSHADAVGIMHRYMEDREELKIGGKYFDYENNIEDYKKWFGCLMLGFFKLFLIFWSAVFKDYTGEKLSLFQGKIISYQQHLESYIKKYPLRNS